MGAELPARKNKEVKKKKKKELVRGEHPFAMRAEGSWLTAVSQQEASWKPAGSQLADLQWKRCCARVEFGMYSATSAPCPSLQYPMSLVMLGCSSLATSSASSCRRHRDTTL